jgi:hypothetical protein
LKKRKPEKREEAGKGKPVKESDQRDGGGQEQEGRAAGEREDLRVRKKAGEKRKKKK